METTMCKYWGDAEGCRTKGHSVCAKSNSSCEIVKPEAKWVTIKGWAHIHNDGKLEIFTLNVDREYYSAPCEIRIKAKYLKGDK